MENNDKKLPANAGTNANKANPGWREALFAVCVVISVLPFMTPALALFLGLAFAFTVGSVCQKTAKKTSKFLLQACVVGLGFGMNIKEALASGKDGMLFTIISVIMVMCVGWLLGKLLKVDGKTSYLISAGTAICGGSAIAAVAPVVKADDDQISVSLGTVFVLNAIALFIFPPIGHALGFDELQFGEWAAIAIHDTSSVVGAGAAYGDKAMETATIIKCTRALWIIPLAFATMAIFREKGRKVSIPWFIFLFVLAMIVNTYLSFPEQLSKGIVMAAKKGLAVTLFLIGSGLSVKTVRNVGVKPLVQGVALWAVIGVLSAAVIKFC